MKDMKDIKEIKTCIGCGITSLETKFYEYTKLEICVNCRTISAKKLVSEYGIQEVTQNEITEKLNKKNKIKPVYVYDLNKYYKKYNMTIDDYNRMFVEQSGCCFICKKHQSELTKKLNVDHNHETGEVRSLLCGNCNIALSLLKENITILDSMIDYIKRFNLKSFGEN